MFQSGLVVSTAQNRPKIERNQPPRLRPWEVCLPLVLPRSGSRKVARRGTSGSLKMNIRALKMRPAILLASSTTVTDRPPGRLTFRYPLLAAARRPPSFLNSFKKLLDGRNFRAYAVV